MTTTPPTPRTGARHALVADVPAVAMALATAFADDPMVTWMSGIADREQRIAATAPGFFRPSVEIGLQRGHVYTVDDSSAGSAGATVWSPPDIHMFTEADGTMLGMAVHEHIGPSALERLMALGEMVGSHHPHDTHFYLFLVGAAVQGRGVGATVIRPVLDRCDSDGLPAYLESSSVTNVSFYERLGFRIIWEDRPGDDGPLFRGMWRDPVRA